MKVFFGATPQQTTGFLEGRPFLIDPNWDALDLSTLSRRQKTVSVNFPHRGSKGPLHLLIDNTGLGMGVTASGTLVSTLARNAGSGAKSTSELMRVP